MKKRKILVGLLFVTSAFALASCNSNSTPTNSNNSGVTTPSVPSTTGTSKQPDNNDDNAKEKYVTFKVKENGEWKNLTSPALITNGKVTIPEAPKVDYYTFRGWFLDEGFKDEFKNKDLDKSITVYAYYIADEVNIVINGESHGTRDLADVINGTYDPGKDLTFDGWYTNPECTVKFNAGDPAKTLYAQSVATITFNNGYEDVYVAKIKPNTVLDNPTTTKATNADGEVIKDDKDNELTIEQNNIVKTYMSSEDIFYVDENGDEIDFSQALSKNTTIKVLWKSPFFKYKKLNDASDDLFCSGYHYGDLGEAIDYDKVDINSVPVISIPSKITVRDDDGNKSIKNVKAAFFQETSTFNSTSLKKVIVQEGIGTIRGFSSYSGISAIESVDLPSSLRIIQNCFNNINGLTQNTVKIPDGVEGIYDSFWSKSNGSYTSTIFYSGTSYDFDINIPDSVKSLSIVPMNFKFSNNSSFVNDGDMIYQNTEKGKVLVQYNNISDGVITIPEGINGIQVGAYINRTDLKMLILPKSFSFINYNLDYNDYKYCYPLDCSQYSCNECYLYTKELSDNDFAYNARMIISTLESMDYVVFQSEKISDEVYSTIGADSTGWATSNGAFTYADNELYKDVKVVNVVETSTPTVIVNFINSYTGDTYSITINRENNNAITLDEILQQIDNAELTNYLNLKNSDHLNVISIKQFGKNYDLTQNILTNKYLYITCEIANYTGFEYEENNNEITITKFDENSAYDLGGNTYGVIIPDEINGKKVTKIADNAFENELQIQVIKLSSNITSIGANAFKNCASLTKVDFNGAKVESIGASAFQNTSLTSLSFSIKNLKSVGAYAFSINGFMEFIPVDGEETRNVTNVSNDEFYFGAENLVNVTGTAYYTAYVTLYQRVNAVTLESGIVAYNTKLYAYAIAGNSNASQPVKFGEFEGNEIVEIMEGAVSYLTSDVKVYFYSVSKIHTNAFTNCEFKSRGIYYYPDGMNAAGSISTVEDLVNAIPTVFEDGWTDNYETIKGLKVRVASN